MSSVNVALIDLLSTRPCHVGYGCRAVSLGIDLHVAGLLEQSNMTKLGGRIIVLMVAPGVWSIFTTGSPLSILSFNN